MRCERGPVSLQSVFNQAIRELSGWLPIQRSLDRHPTPVSRKSLVGVSIPPVLKPSESMQQGSEKRRTRRTVAAMLPAMVAERTKFWIGLKTRTQNVENGSCGRNSWCSVSLSIRCIDCKHCGSCKCCHHRQYSRL
jgi:hypothetical protein